MTLSGRCPQTSRGLGSGQDVWDAPAPACVAAGLQQGRRAVRVAAARVSRAHVREPAVRPRAMRALRSAVARHLLRQLAAVPRPSNAAIWRSCCWPPVPAARSSACKRALHGCCTAAGCIHCARTHPPSAHSSKQAAAGLHESFRPRAADGALCILATPHMSCWGGGGRTRTRARRPRWAC